MKEIKFTDVWQGEGTYRHDRTTGEWEKLSEEEAELSWKMSIEKRNENFARLVANGFKDKDGNSIRWH
jgi:hypothetical protein